MHPFNEIPGHAHVYSTYYLNIMNTFDQPLFIECNYITCTNL